MAITKIVGAIHAASGPAKHIGMKKLIDYILNPEKTGNGLYTGSLNCSTMTALKEMAATTRHFGKDSDNTGNRLGYHFVISWSPKENVSDETAFRVISEFCEQFLGKEYETVYSLHNDTKHKHGHIAFNSVNCQTGRKFRYEDGDWAKKIQPLVDGICEKYGLHTLEVDTGLSNEEYFAEHIRAKNGKRKNKTQMEDHTGQEKGSDKKEKMSCENGTGKGQSADHRNKIGDKGMGKGAPGSGVQECRRARHKYYKEKDAPVSQKEYIRLVKKAIDCLIPECRTFEEFVRRLREKGFKVRMGKHISVWTEGMPSHARLDTIGGEYAQDRIRERIEGAAVHGRPEHAGPSAQQDRGQPVQERADPHTAQEMPGDGSGSGARGNIRKTVDYLIPKCRTFDDFLQKMREAGFEVKMGKHISVRGEGMLRYARLDTIGGEYAQDRIRDRIEGAASYRQQPQAVSLLPPEALEELKRYRTGEERRYFAQIYRMSLVSVAGEHFPTYRNVCKNAREIKKLTEMAHIIHEKGICTSGDAAGLAGESREALEAARQVRRGLNKDKKKYAQLIRTYKELKEMGCGHFLAGEGNAAFEAERLKYDRLQEKFVQFGYQFDEVEDFMGNLEDGLKDTGAQIRKLESDIRTYEEIQKRFEEAERENEAVQDQREQDCRHEAEKAAQQEKEQAGERQEDMQAVRPLKTGRRR